MNNLWKFLTSDRAPEVMKQFRLLIRDIADVLK
jgi:hypothetical protein